MALLMKRIASNYIYVMDELPDPRTAHFSFVRSPVPIMFVIVTYLLFVKKIGPKLMENREPFKLDFVLKVYNVFQVLANLALLVIVAGPLSRMNLLCAEIDQTAEDYDAVTMMYLVMGYSSLKILDLLDTVFFVLRKKFCQITFLHVYHHIVMVCSTWIFTKYLPGGHSAFLGIINCIVHCVMYSYYFLTVYDKTYVQSLWWKKHLTQLQLFQFVLVVLTYLPLMLQADCKYPKLPAYFILLQNFLMIMLFSDFYYNTYIKKKST